MFKNEILPDYRSYFFSVQRFALEDITDMMHAMAAPLELSPDTLFFLCFRVIKSGTAGIQHFSRNVDVIPLLAGWGSSFYSYMVQCVL